MCAVLAQRFGACLGLAALVLAALLTGQACAAQVTPTRAMRFEQALAALKAHDLARYRALAAGLHGYILRPYLRFAYLQATLKTATAAQIKSFVKRNGDLPIANQLRHSWLLELARRKAWTQLLAADHPATDGTLIACARAVALQATGQQKAAEALAKRLWLVGYGQPKQCNPALGLLRRNGHVPSQLVIDRMVLALRYGNVSLAGYLAMLLPPGARLRTQRWLEVYTRPATLLHTAFTDLGSPPRAGQVLTATLRHFGRRHPASAHALWARLQPRLQGSLSQTQQDRITRTIAVFAAIDGLHQGERWLADLPADVQTPLSREWRARAALRNADWHGLLAAIQAMPRWQRDYDVWRYWEARALLLAGRIAAGRRLADPLAREFSYYGFLAADLIQRPYAKGPQPAPPDPVLQKRIGKMHLVRIALALHTTGLSAQADDLWRELVSHLSPRARLAAARLAHRQGWAYGAYTAAAQSPGSGASALTFPLAHWSAVRLAARSNGLAPDLVLALMRQESAFQSTVCSSAGACGLMQLMPSTACWIGKRSNLGQRFCDPERLSEPGVSIRAGSDYLSYLMGLFANDVVAAVAAYNAGPGNVTHWLANPALRIDTPRWVATLPFGETRRYIQAVLFNRVVYARRSEVARRSASRELTLRLSDLLGSLGQAAPSS